MAPPRMRSSHAAEPAALANAPVKSVRYLGNQFLENTVGVTGIDGATSTVLPSGDAFWLFGDTIEGPFETIRGLDLTRFCSNTAAVVPRQDVSQGIKQFRFLASSDAKRPRQIIPFAPDENPADHRVWGIHGACVGPRIYLFYHRITLLKGVDVFVNFKLDGMGIARADVGEYEFTRLTAPDGTHEFWKGDVPTFGVFVERLGDYLYLWGSLATGMYLARTRPGTIEDLDSYEYLVAAPTPSQPDVIPRWAKKFEPTAMLFDSVPNEMSAAYNPYLRQHVVFQSLHRENKVVMRTAPQITGQWSEPQLVYQPAKVTDADLIYATKEHPELAAHGGRVLYVTFVNSSTYVPQMIEVTLK
jgi:hypothetical protein